MWKSIVEMEADQCIPYAYQGHPGAYGSKAWSKFSSYWLHTFLNRTCQEASRIRSSVDRDFPEGLRAEAASHYLVPLKLILVVL